MKQSFKEGSQQTHYIFQSIYVRLSTKDPIIIRNTHKKNTSIKVYIIGALKEQLINSCKEGKNTTTYTYNR